MLAAKRLCAMPTAPQALLVAVGQIRRDPLFSFFLIEGVDFLQIVTKFAVRLRILSRFNREDSHDSTEVTEASPKGPVADWIGGVRAAKRTREVCV
jgi:hypothetical protein